ncbi:MHS family MFS transporter [Streptomyces sp. NBC_00257]|uniref:MFS transporter n=1 Tax=unclassified Streptomyces TaxID=2593676 RepID=UPI002251D730|nr:MULTISPECIES: MFS transporter [unclassified Streptomyces]WSW08785.1 MHS family MFS transporter [Streptomyces sp. NBC_01005]WTB53384.1 MHS family MFS transporter [Streptomyces sp. NBC_00826]WTC98290.1 MHS family MFS transporter [Streptomyces sp. NBC_01650]WTH93725.1 MHS family MFS transporter [Streptomyces sp. NBC_00825]WTI02459.1 MHS family MFS transporter [Streptomyces sp. NBC_00822]
MNTSPHEEHSGGARATAGRTALATLAGTTLEWYDFFLYGTAAALIFNEQFFPSLSPAAGTLAAFSTFAVGFIARPLGGLVFGHYGDRIGRKATLVVSLVLMGIGSTLIGAIPSYASIGFWAPVLLVTLRIVQGIGLGGEGAGATLMSMEHAPPGKKNLYAGFPQMGTPGGLVLANVIFLVTNAVMGDHAFTSWGWRIPFLLSFVLVAVGLVIRLRVTESPSFDRVRAQDQVVRFPLAESMKVGFPRLALTLLAVVANSAVAYVFMVFTLSYGSQHLDYDKQFLIVSVTVAAALWFVTIPVWTKIADRHGRRTMFIAGSAAILVWCVAFFPLINTGNSALAVVALLGMGLIIPVTHCVQGSIIVDTFPVNVRYSGSSVILQGGAILGGGLAPMISTALLNSGGSSTGVTWYLVGICAVSLAGAVALFRLVPEGAPEPVRAAPAKSLSGSGA